MLEKTIKVEIKIIDFPIASAYETITRCHKDAFDYADYHDYGIFIIMPDCVFDNNFISHLQSRVKQGARLISVPNFRANLEGTTLSLLDYYDNNDVLNINTTQLMRVGLNNMHFITKCGIWEKSEGYLMPSMLFWLVANNGGFVARYFYSCSIYIHPTHKFNNLHCTFDVDYIFQACPDQSLHYACTNSDDALVLELTTESRRCSGFPKAFIHHLKYFASHLNKYQIDHSKHVFMLSTGLASDEDWAQAVQDSNAVLEQVYAQLD